MALHLFLWCCWILASPWHSCVEGIWWKLSKQRFDAMTTFALWEFHIQVAFCGGDARLLAMHGRWDCRQKKLLILRQSLRALESWDEERGCCTYIWPYIDMYIYIYVITVYGYEYWDVWPCAYNKHGVLDDEWWYVFQAEVEPAIVACRGARFVDVSMIAWAFASTNQATPALMEEVQWKGLIRGWGWVSKGNI